MVSHENQTSQTVHMC